jgi:hypothetical protein
MGRHIVGDLDFNKITRPQAIKLPGSWRELALRAYRKPLGKLLEAYREPLGKLLGKLL